MVAVVTPAPALAVELADVRRRFGAKPALDGLSLRVPTGTIAVLLGPNGAGKTTAIRAVTGALAPDEGRVRTLGLDPVADGEEVRRRCGVVSAKPALYDRLSGRDNLAYAAELYGLARRDARIGQAAARFGIADALDRQVGGWSTGMKTRLALARAVLHAPDLLLLDEPTSGLDPESSTAVLAMIRDMARDGATVVMCTHLLLEAEGLADQVVVLEAGRDLASGPPAELVRRFWSDTIVRLGTGDVADAALVAAQPGVVGVDVDADGATLVARLDQAARVPDVVAALCRAGRPVWRVEPFEPTLEDLYFAIRAVPRGTMTAVRDEVAA